MSKKEGDVVPVTKQIDQFMVMLEDAEVDFDLEMSDTSPKLEVEGLTFSFDNEGNLIGVEND